MVTAMEYQSGPDLRSFGVLLRQAILAFYSVYCSGSKSKAVFMYSGYVSRAKYEDGIHLYSSYASRGYETTSISFHAQPLLCPSHLILSLGLALTYFVLVVLKVIVINVIIQVGRLVIVWRLYHVHNSPSLNKYPGLSGSIEVALPAGKVPQNKSLA